MADQARDKRILRWSTFLKHPQPDPACQIIDRRRPGNQGGLWPSTAAVIQQLNSHRIVSPERPIIRAPAQHHSWWFLENLLLFSLSKIMDIHKNWVMQRSHSVKTIRCDYCPQLIQPNVQGPHNAIDPA